MQFRPVLWYLYLDWVNIYLVGDIKDVPPHLVGKVQTMIYVGILIYLAVFVIAYRADSSDLDLFEDVSKRKGNN
jgi:hypothetical protein